VMLTSALPEEGKSFVTLNLALALKELGRKVLLIDADLRRPTVHKNLGLDLEPGLSTYLQGKAEIGELPQLAPSHGDLVVITAGLTPQQPTDLLTNPKLSEMIEALKKNYQYILLDTPPVLAVADTSALARIVDGIVFVTRAQKTHREAVVAGKQRLLDVGGKIIGGILNGARLEHERGYRYYYYTRQYRQDQEPARPKRSSRAS
jgi:capsular exopolysaccharide synthesis family protein